MRCKYSSFKIYYLINCIVRLVHGINKMRQIRVKTNSITSFIKHIKYNFTTMT